MKTQLVLGHHPLSIQELMLAIRFKNLKVSLSPHAIKKIKESYQYIQSEIKKDKTIYGVNTGFGILSNVRIQNHQLQELQVNLIRSHAVGVGEPLSQDLVKLMMILRAHQLALGYSGVRLELVQKIIELINAGIYPIIPSQGSVGASGDLAPLSHLALPLIGEGEVTYQNKRYSTEVLFKKLKIKPIILGPKEGLALINGTQFMCAHAIECYTRARYLVDYSDAIGALSVEAMRGTSAAFDPLIHAIRPHSGQITSAKNVLSYLREKNKGSKISESHVDCTKVQDPYSLRCIPQVHGTSRDAIQNIKGIIETEINSVTDNPLVFAKEKKILSGGNFHGQALAMGLDFLAIAVAELASISEQRIEKLVNPVISELPAFLVKNSGIQSGFMIVQVAAASLVSENKTLCHPACVDTIPTSADKEDHVSMGAWAGIKCQRVIQNSENVLSMESLAACQGIELLRPLRSTQKLENIISQIRKISAPLTQDRSLSADIMKLAHKIKNQEISL